MENFLYYSLALAVALVGIYFVFVKKGKQYPVDTRTPSVLTEDNRPEDTTP